MKQSIRRMFPGITQFQPTRPVFSPIIKLSVTSPKHTQLGTDAPPVFRAAMQPTGTECAQNQLPVPPISRNKTSPPCSPDIGNPSGKTGSAPRKTIEYQHHLP
jgi:hypothetical protein